MFYASNASNFPNMLTLERWLLHSQVNRFQELRNIQLWYRNNSFLYLTKLPKLRQLTLEIELYEPSCFEDNQGLAEQFDEELIQETKGPKGIITLRRLNSFRLIMDESWDPETHSDIPQAFADWDGYPEGEEDGEQVIKTRKEVVQQTIAEVVAVGKRIEAMVTLRASVGALVVRRAASV